MPSSAFNRVFSGLSRQMLTWFLVLSLVPLSVISWVSYRNAGDQLYKNAAQALADVSRLQTENIRAGFNRMVIDLTQESELHSNSQFLSALVKAFQASGKSATDFVKSFRWALLEDENSADLKTFWNAYGYYNILLIDKAGNILFTFTREPDLGLNLFQGSLATTRFAQAAKESLTSGKVVFSDLQRYAPSNNAMSGFLVAPLLADDGTKLGLIAFQLSEDQITQLISGETQFGETGHRYLIGSDLTLRSAGALGGDFSILNKTVETVQSQKWYTEHVIGGALTDPGDQPVLTYPGPLGPDVLGLHGHIDIAGVQWGYIAEINTDEALRGAKKLKNLILALIGITLFLVIAIALRITRRMVRPLVDISDALIKVGDGDLQQRIALKADNELGTLAQGFNGMIDKLRESAQQTETQHWLQEGVNQLNETMQGEQNLAEFARNTVAFLCPYVGAQIGAFYGVRDTEIQLLGSYAFSARKGFRNTFSIGEGIVGQAALEQQTLIISPVPEDYFSIASGLGETPPKVITVTPLVWNKKVLALIEFGTHTHFNPLHQTLIDQVSTRIAIAMQTALSRDETQTLLERTQTQSEELQTREEELRTSNTLLERQARDLQSSAHSQHDIQLQLEEKNQQLQVQQEELRIANEALEGKAQDLRTASDYKSQFLANMSHELRTPLNSLLILAKLLTEEQQTNLSKDQQAYLQTIYASGSDLLDLINDILDLAKIESGKMEVQIEPISLHDFTFALHEKFQTVASKKNIDFQIETQDAPSEWHTDGQKLNQIMHNFLSNALKFTEQGCITLSIGSIPAGTALKTPTLTAKTGFALSVTDTGIGIPRQEFQSIFGAFQQADGSTRRQYGGTGLGLSISQELAALLGGEIHLESQEGLGSTFTLYLPKQANNANQQPVIPAPPAHEAKMLHDTRTIFADRTVLVVDDDERNVFALSAQLATKGMHVIEARNGVEALSKLNANVDIVLMDIMMPEMDGYEAIRKIRQQGFVNLPIIALTAKAMKGDRAKCIDVGASDYLAKPVDTDKLSSMMQVWLYQ